MDIVALRYVGSEFQDQQSNPCPLHCEYRVLNQWNAREVPGKSSLLGPLCPFMLVTL